MLFQSDLRVHLTEATSKRSHPRHIDDNTSRHVLKLDDYGGDGVDSWVLLEALA